jgi:nitroreductase
MPANFAQASPRAQAANSLKEMSRPRGAEGSGRDRRLFGRSRTRPWSSVHYHALAFLARGYGLDTCPQEAWARLYDTVGDYLKLPLDQMLFCGMAVGYGDREHKANAFRSPRADLSEFCKLYGFD